MESLWSCECGDTQSSQTASHTDTATYISYLVLSGISALDSYRQGHTIFVGKRKMLAKRVSEMRGFQRFSQGGHLIHLTLALPISLD